MRLDFGNQKLWAAQMNTLVSTLLRMVGLRRTISRSAFRDAFVAELRRRSSGVVVRPEGEQAAVLGEGPDERTVSVETAYQYYLSQPARADELIGLLVDSAMEDPNAPLSDPDRLVVIVRPAALAEQDGFEGVRRPLAGDLMQVLAVDTPASLRYAGAKDLAAVGLSEPDAWARAADNTLKLLGPLEIGELEPGLMAVSADSGFATSLLISPEWVRQQVGETSAVLLVTRDMFVYAPLGDAAATKAFWRFAGASWGDARVPLTARDGAWIAATPPAA